MQVHVRRLAILNQKWPLTDAHSAIYGTVNQSTHWHAFSWIPCSCRPKVTKEKQMIESSETYRRRRGAMNLRWPMKAPIAGFRPGTPISCRRLRVSTAGLIGSASRYRRRTAVTIIHSLINRQVIGDWMLLPFLASVVSAFRLSTRWWSVMAANRSSGTLNRTCWPTIPISWR